MSQKSSFKNESSLAWWFCMQSKDKPPTIILLGNSFANQLYPGFARNEKLRSQTILSIGTCAIGYNGEDDAPGSPCYGKKSEDQAKFLDETIASNPTIKFAVLDGFVMKPTSAYIERVIARIKYLEEKQIKVVIFTPHIRPGFDPKACFRSPLRQQPKDCVISPEVRNTLSRDFDPLLLSIKKELPGVLFFDQNDVFCDRPDGKCSFVKNGMPLHRDEVHISEYASILIQDYFTQWASMNLPTILDRDKQTGLPSAPAK